MAGGTTLEYTPTWIVAIVCTIMVVISLAVERLIHLAGKHLKRKNQKPLYEALQKIKEELMLLGFISLLLTVFQYRIVKICISEKLGSSWLPCDKSTKPKKDSSSSSGYDTCTNGKVPLLSVTALHHLHTFIFVLAVAHVTFSVLTMLFGGLKIRQWKQWEDEVSKKDTMNPEEVFGPKFTHVQDHDFIKNRYKGIGKKIVLFSWMQSFFKQFYASVTKTDYLTLRLGFIMTHCRGNPKFNFHKYMIRALESDFKKVVGISWYLWSFVVVFLLLNVDGWNAYFWISFIPLVLVLAVGMKLEHIITQLAQEVADKHAAIEGDLVVMPSDDHFWFHRPRIVLFLIHIILFQNSFELAFFFWILAEYGFDSCIMGKVGFIIPRLVIGVFVQFLCSYSTLPLYALVTQMGTMFKKEIFEENIQVGLVGWAKQAKKKTKLVGGMKSSNNGSSTPVVTPRNVSASPSASPSTSLISGAEMQNFSASASASPEIQAHQHNAQRPK